MGFGGFFFCFCSYVCSFSVQCGVGVVFVGVFFVYLEFVLEALGVFVDLTYLVQLKESKECQWQWEKGAWYRSSGK